MLLLFSVPTFGQGIRFGDQQPVQSVQTPGGPIYSVPNATINFCNSPANGVPCTNKVTTYTDITLTTACPTSTQVVLSGTNSCVATTDQYGNWGVWISPGVYTFTVQVASGAAIGPYTVTISGGGGSILPTVNNWLALNNFTAGATIFGLPIAGFSGTFTIGDCPIVSSTNPLQFFRQWRKLLGRRRVWHSHIQPAISYICSTYFWQCSYRTGWSGIYTDSSGGNLLHHQFVVQRTESAHRRARLWREGGADKPQHDLHDQRKQPIRYAQLCFCYWIPSWRRIGCSDWRQRNEPIYSLGSDCYIPGNFRQQIL